MWQVRQPLTELVPLYLHLIVGPRGAALVDGGLPSSLPAVNALLSQAEVSDPELRFMLNTHGHHDHIGTFAPLRTRTGAHLVAAPAAVRWIEDLDANLREFALHRPDIVADSPELRAELAPTYGVACPVDVTMTDGGSVHLGDGVVIDAIALPGHVAGELGWFERSTRTLLLGDVVTGTAWDFFHGHVLPGELRQSLRKLRALTVAEDVQLVCMAHYASRTGPQFLELVADVERYLALVTETVQSALGSEPRSLTQIWRRTCSEMQRVEEFRGLAMVQAHLDEAVAEGSARCVGPDLYVGI